MYASSPLTFLELSGLLLFLEFIRLDFWKAFSVVTGGSWRCPQHFPPRLRSCHYFCCVLFEKMKENNALYVEFSNKVLSQQQFFFTHLKQKMIKDSFECFGKHSTYFYAEKITTKSKNV